MKTKTISKIKEEEDSGDNTDFENDESFTEEEGENADEFLLEDDEANEQTVEKKRKKMTEEESDVAPQKKKKKLDKNLYKQPTVEELNELRETENLFHSNLFRLQIEEVLNEVKIKDKYKRLFGVWFEKLKTTIESIEETEEFQVSNRSFEDTLNVHTPMSLVPEETKAVFKFLKPSNISVIGSFPLECTVGPNITIDVMVEMPAKLFQKQDYQNYRYLRKKAIYLAYITSSIKEDIAEKKTFIRDGLRSVLKIVPAGKLSKRTIVRIHVSAQEETFKLNRFLPEKNNVRPKWYFEENYGNENESLPPTPHYNSIILHDLTMSRVNLENENIIKQYPNIRDGIILLKIWLGQRELMKGLNAFNGHIITMLVLYLLQVKKINTFMSSYQIVRNVWNHLAQFCWCENGIAMSQDDGIQERVTDYHKYYECVFLDTTGYHNLTATISKALFSWVQREADLCLKHLDNIYVDSFQSIFMRKVPFYRAFDHIISFRNTEELQKIVHMKSSNNDKLDYGPDKYSQAAKIILEVLTKGLRNRVHRICILPNEPQEWKCKHRLVDSIGKIIIGLELNPDSCFSIIDKGPEANLPEAVDFRNFWGNKSELRRFQDGSICEAVVWSKGKTLSDKRAICKKIILFLLEEKLDIHNFQYIANGIEELLRLPKIRITHFAYGTGEEATLKAIQAFNSIEKDLMSLTDVPLSINGVQGSSAVFRYTEVFPPLATVHPPNPKFSKMGTNCLILEDVISKVPNYVHPLEVTLQLSTSGKWPEELEAIRKTKAAFHLQIADCLRKQHNLKVQANYSYLDVYKDGFVFRMRIAHQKEIALLKQQVGEDGIIKYKDNEESIELENKLFHLPQLTGALHGLHSQQPTFGPTCCLAKRWLSAQLLDNYHIPDIVVELLVASMYLMPEPYKPAQAPQVAFLRLLEIFAREFWITDPVIVNFNNEMSKEEIVSVETLFRTERNSLPPLFISMPYDQQKSLWTKKAPTILTLNRIGTLARESLKFIEHHLTETRLSYKSIFRPPLSEYDCLIHLKPSLNPRRLEAVDVPKKHPIVGWHPYKPHWQQKVPVTDFDPIQCYLKELRAAFDEVALFFHDTYGGMVIAVLLKPSALERKDFKVSNINCRKLDDDGKLSLNVSALIQDFYILGKDLVKSIDVRTKEVSLI